MTGFGPEHELFRQAMRRFVELEISPHATRWDEAEEFPRELYAKAASVGLLGLGFPEEYGGTPGDAFHLLAAVDELCKAGSGGISAGLMSHGIALPPILALGSEELKRRVIPPVLRGDHIAALCVSEPSGGSDVANLQTSARREGDHWVVNGSKTFITSGMRADVLTVAVRTGGPGMSGISILVVEGQPTGLSRTSLSKMGWWASDTATLHFEDVRVPLENLVGEENQGFFGLMLNFNRERLGLAANAVGFAKVAYEEAVAWARERQTFGRPLIERQVIRHKLVDMATEIAAASAFLESVAAKIDRGDAPLAEICMLKNVATRCTEFCAKEAVQILGGAGFIRGTKSERIYRETKVLSIGGGTEEIMKELASRHLGW